MKLLLWVGNEPNQKALANKLAEQFEVVGIVTESRNQKRKITFSKLVDALYEKLILSSINKAWSNLRDYYEQQFTEYPLVARIDVENINSKDAIEFSSGFEIDLIVVSGTSLIKNTSLEIYKSVGILNLHTGLSPYVNGGPNCTNWCIATNQYHLIGNTVMWIDEGIDSGNIVCTECTKLERNDSLIDIHKKVMDHAHELCIKAILFLSKGGESSVAQSSIANGRTYYSKEWKLKHKINLVGNLNQNRGSDFESELENKRREIKTINLALKRGN